MWPFNRNNQYAVYKPRWANSVLAYNTSFRKCTHCERLIEDGKWFKVQKENSHFITFDSEQCIVSYDVKHGPKPE